MKINRQAIARARMHARDPRCHWCDKITVLRPRIGNGAMQPDTCTLEHLFERQIGPRARSEQGQRRWVIACNQCNTERGTAHSRKLNGMLGTEKARIRSQLGHLIKQSASWARLFIEPAPLGVLMDMGREGSIGA